MRLNNTYGKLSIALSVLSSIGVVATALSAANATTKAAKILEEDIPVKEKVEKTWMFYIPTAGIAVGTILCIAGASILNQKQQASLISAYKLLEASYKNYVGGVKEIFGEDAHQQVLEHIHAEEADPPLISAASFLESTTLDFENAPEKTLLFCYKFGDKERYFTSTISKVIQAEYHLNRNNCLGWDQSLMDFYQFLGLTSTDEDKHWMFTDSEQDGYLWIDFNHSKIFVDGQPCYLIESTCTPYYEIGSSGYFQ